RSPPTTAHQTPSEVKSDNVTKKCDDVNVADKEKPIEDLPG
ncbi:hypothetical protein Tco_1118227, partial [Tanacetum coccineum]